MGVRISNLPNQPSITETDFLVIDSTDGTRKVPINQSIILSGVTSQAKIGRASCRERV